MTQAEVRISSAQVRAARGLLDWSQSRLAEAAAVGNSTVKDFEAGRRDPYNKSVAAIRSALEQAGVTFTNGDEPGVKLRKHVPLAVGAGE